jgi:competence protein ComEA
MERAITMKVGPLARRAGLALIPAALVVLLGHASAQAPSASGGAHTVLPENAGRDTLIKVCSNCHSPDIVAMQRHDAQGWADLVQIMAGRGANATDDQFDQIIDYLAKSFPETKAPGAVPPRAAAAPDKAAQTAKRGVSL